LQRGRLHKYGNLMVVMLQHVDVVAMGSRPSDSVVSFWSDQDSAAVFDLVFSSYGISSRRKKRLESLSCITLNKMMVEINKYEEKLMLLEVVVADGGIMV
jgi:ABC-type cobalamin/Fe3+-siderophores transport system ATPase subunit